MKLFKTVISSIISILFSSNISFADNSIANHSPSYQEGKLTIPHVDTQEIVGKFQDATFEFNEQTGSWELLEFRETRIATINEVTVIKPDSFPEQILLEISGLMPNSCYTLEPVNQRLEGNRFDIAIPIVNVNPGSLCLDVLSPFTTIVPLSVYGLGVGSYEYSVMSSDGNNTSGTFTLSADNNL